MALERAKISAFLKQFTPNVYYQSPPSTGMKYPCILYERQKPKNKGANNALYLSQDIYELTVIDRNPDSVIAESFLRDIRFDAGTNFKSEGLYHFIFTVNIYNL